MTADQQTAFEAWYKSAVLDRYPAVSTFTSEMAKWAWNAALEWESSLSRFSSVKLACERLTDEELAAINNIAQWGADPRKVIGYDKVAHLFTEAGGLKMHSATQDSLAAVVLQRLGESDHV